METYCLRLFKDQRMVGGKNFQANDAMAARLIAASLFDRCCERSDGAELWQGASQIDWQPPLSATAIRAANHGQIIETEITLANSAWAIERGRRLLAAQAQGQTETDCLMLLRQGRRK